MVTRLGRVQIILDAVQSVLLNWSSVYFDTSAVNAWRQNVIASVADAGPAASSIKIASACFILRSESRGPGSGGMRYSRRGGSGEGICQWLGTRGSTL